MLGGKPVIRGTRLAVEFVLGLLADGWTREQLRENYLQLTDEALRAARAMMSSRRASRLPAHHQARRAPGLGASRRVQLRRGRRGPFAAVLPTGAVALSLVDESEAAERLRDSCMVWAERPLLDGEGSPAGRRGRRAWASAAGGAGGPEL